MVRIRKANDIEKAAYRNTKPVYPLYGFIHNGERELAVEDLSGSWSRPDPIYEVMAPKGFRFETTDTHSLLCFTQKDVQDRVRSEGWVVLCDRDCCKEAK